MTRGSPRREERVFLVRMWLERTPQNDAWRGSVHDVSTGRRLYVTGPGEVADFIATGLAGAPEATELAGVTDPDDG